MVKNAVQLVKDAVKNNEFCELLEGKGEYYWEDLFVTIPTDWGIIIHRGIYGAYKENPDLGVDKLLEESILKLSKGNIEQLYVAFMVMLYQIEYEEDNEAPFKINRNKILHEVEKEVLKNKDGLSKFKKWQCCSGENGTWGEILRQNKRVYEEYNVKLLPQYK